MELIIKFTVFFLILIYTVSFAVYEFTSGNKTGAAAVIALSLLASVIFANYLG